VAHDQERADVFVNRSTDTLAIVEHREPRQALRFPTAATSKRARFGAPLVTPQDIEIEYHFSPSHSAATAGMAR
jgi:hypothetical protein